MWRRVSKHLNFYRIHLLCLYVHLCYSHQVPQYHNLLHNSAVIPLLSALILWLSNGEFKIPFIDVLFVCISAATGTGLSTVDLSSMTAWQQTILVIVELGGNPVSSSVLHAL